MVNAATKTCSNCQACKPAALFKKKGNQCKVCVAAKDREYRERNKAKVLAGKRKYRENNKEKLAASKRKYRQTRRRERYRTDPQFALKKRLRRRMSGAVNNAGLYNKCDTTSNLLGITYRGLKEWLEAHFTKGMSWENRDKWHVDHRVPCDAFDMTVPEQQRICFWYRNLQPLWAKDNLEKSNTYRVEDKQALVSAYYNQ